MAGDVTVAVVSGQLATGTGSPSGEADFIKSGFGTPKACIVLVTWDISDDTNTAGQSKVSIGFSDFTNGYCITHQDEDVSAKVDCDALKSNTKAYVLLNPAGSVVIDGTAATITDGVRLTNTTASFGRRTTVIMFAGADLAISLQSSAINSSQDGTATISHSGFTDGNDKLIFFIGSDISGEDSTSAGINNSFGVCHATGSDSGGWTLVQRCMGWASDHGASVGTASSIMSTDRVLDILTEAGGQDWGLEVTAFSNSSGTWTVATRDNGAGAGMEVYSLALDLDDRKAKVERVDSPISGSTWSITGVGFKPQYVGIGITRAANDDTIITDSSAGAEGISSNAGSGKETFHGWYNDDGAETTNTNNNFRSRVIDHRLGDVSAVRQDHSHLSFDSDGVTHTINSETETFDRSWFYWAIEEVAAGDTTISVPQESLTETDNDPVINTGVAVVTPQESLSQTDNDPAVGTGVIVDVPQDALTETDNAPTVPQIVGVPQDSLSQGDNIPLVSTGVTIAVPVDTLTQTDHVPVITAADAGFVPYPNPRYAMIGGMQSMSGGV